MKFLEIERNLNGETTPTAYRSLRVRIAERTKFAAADRKIKINIASQ